MTMHTCPAEGCQMQVSRMHLACRPHWYQLPKPLRDAIWQTHKSGDRTAWSKNVTEAKKIWSEHAAERGTP